MSYYDRKGRALTFEQYIELLKKPESKRVAETHVGPMWVSTVWLGLDHGWNDRLPIIFETMVFGGPLEGEQERYSTEEEALAGHERWVQKAREALS